LAVVLVEAAVAVLAAYPAGLTWGRRSTPSSAPILGVLRARQGRRPKR
jgi:hypothetical protein